jgi:hypothetical protein
MICLLRTAGADGDYIAMTSRCMSATAQRCRALLPPCLLSHSHQPPPLVCISAVLPNPRSSATMLTNQQCENLVLKQHARAAAGFTLPGIWQQIRQAGSPVRTSSRVTTPSQERCAVIWTSCRRHACAGASSSAPRPALDAHNLMCYLTVPHMRTVSPPTPDQHWASAQLCRAALERLRRRRRRCVPC